MVKKIVLFAFLWLTASWGFAQVNPGLKNTMAAIDALSAKLPIEKLYLQTDKPYYTSGDTLRFKTYLVNADFLTPSTRSGLLYVELDNSNGQMVKRIMIPVMSGISWGDIALDQESMPEGSYILRAYTNWMRNFGEDYVFKKRIYISSATGTSTLIQSSFKLTDKGDKSNIAANLRFATASHEPWRLKDLQLRVMNGRHNLIRDKASTGVDGIVNVNFDLADKTALHNLYITAQQTGKGADTAVFTIPVMINRMEKTDLQFMPEGGNLVAGIKTKVGFKAISEDGQGVAISGKIYNSKQQQAAAFTSAYKGMGNFGFTPEAGETYTARVTLPDGTTKAYPLPPVNATGTALAVKPSTKDSITLTLSTTANLINDASTYYLLSQARGVICYAQTIKFINQKPVKITLATSLFPTGITRFILLNADKQALNERQVFIQHHDDLQVSITPNKTNYTTRDSIALSIDVKDSNGKPVQGSFALSVTDDDQVRTDSLGSNILNHLLLTSDLKGTVETPGYYFTQTNPQKATELDNLMLTQGWVGYDWKQVLSSKEEEEQPQYIAEAEFTVKGKVINIFNKPNVGAKVALFSRNPTIIRDTVTDKDGIFTFKGLFPVDTAIYRLSSHNKKGRDNVSIEMLNEFKPPVFKPENQTQIPWYVNSDTVLLNNSSTRLAQLKAEANFRGEGTQLKEVVIKEKKIIKESENLNGPGEADEVWDEHDMAKANKMTLSAYLEKNVKGFAAFGIWTFWAAPNGVKIYAIPYNYTMYGKRIKFIIDGVDIEAVRTGNDRYQYIRSILDFFTAEDITGIELMFNNKRINEYSDKYVGVGSFNRHNYAYLEITTRAKQGPFVKKTPGSYLYKPMPFTLPKQFYSPKYTIQNKNKGIGTDLRSTIYWEPNITTDINGKATVSFYSADKPAGYTAIVEGMDLNDDIGYTRQKIGIVKK